MILKFNKYVHKRLILSIILFIAVFCCFALIINQTWFREDDLGTLINGRVTDWTSAVRVFCADCRSFITPSNYQRTMPNFISALWRPLQNYIFSIIFYILGPKPMAFYFLQTFFHALNASLLFILFSFFLPLGFAFLGGFLFAFYPSVSWMIWASTLQNSLSVFFLILMMICLYKCCLHCRPWHINLSKPFYFLAGIFYFLSLLSRENGLFLPIWLWMGVWICLMLAKSGFWSNVWESLKVCWIFFVSNIVYSLLRIFIFGFGTLDRTFANLFLRFPFLNKIFAQTQNALINESSKAISQSSTVVKTSVVAHSAEPCFLWILWQKAFKWIEAIFCITPKNASDQIWITVAVLALSIFVIYSFRQQKNLFLWLFFGLGCLLWPGVLAYPSPRYINAAYPMIIFIFIYSLYLFYISGTELWKKTVCYALCFAAFLFACAGLRSNINELRFFAQERIAYKQRFDAFFSQHKFHSNVNFVLVCSPFVSDIESIFQYYLNNYSICLVFDPFSTVAERGIMGCSQDYRIIGVKSEILKIPGGFRLISHDEQHCGWWLRHSNFNIAWCAKERAYRWTDKQYITGVWYDCSVGRFMINKMASPDCATDISFVYDSHWINNNTVFIGWDTLKGRYFLL